jgi:VIT1/CCC1 family predicted Fe2+/Mn2+ transporter
VFGANDGLVSNLSLVAALSASGVDNRIVLLTGIAGLLAGALSMGAGEYVSVRSQRELLDASTPDLGTDAVLPQLDLDANELALLYRARGMDPAAAQSHADEVLGALDPASTPRLLPAAADDRGDPGVGSTDEHEAIGTSLGAAVSSFCFFASGAIVPVLPYLLGLQGLTAVIVAAVLVGLALLATGATVGLLSGASPLKRGVRQLGIGYGAAAVTYLLGLLFGTATA